MGRARAAHRASLRILGCAHRPHPQRATEAWGSGWDRALGLWWAIVDWSTALL